MKYKSQLSASSPTFLLLGVASCFISSTVHAVDKSAQGSGDWPGITWSPAGDPGQGDTIAIGNGYSVDYIGDDDEGRYGNLEIGSDFDGSGNTFTRNGTLTISGGSLQTAANGSGAMRIGAETDSIGVLNVTGGTLDGDGVGWLTAGYGTNSNGTVNLSGSGVIQNLSNLSLGSGVGSTGTLNVSGGSLQVDTDFYVGRVSPNANQGVFNQTSGFVVIDRNLRIGNATSATHNPTGTASLTGGFTSVNGNIILGNTSNGVNGVGKLSIGPNANLSAIASDSTLMIGGDGELEFLLGSTTSFNAIDLTAATSGVALSFDVGSLITIDGSNLASDFDGTIVLATYGSGRGPTEFSLGNIVIDFANFDPALMPSVDWTDTEMLLTVMIPEPSAKALIFGLATLGLVAARRRRSVSSS